jgi:hypothetical protein
MTSSRLAALTLTDLGASPPPEPGITPALEIRLSLSKPPGGPDAKHPKARLRGSAAVATTRADLNICAADLWAAAGCAATGRRTLGDHTPHPHPHP